MTPVWVDKAVVLALHDAQVTEHGGSTGLRDDGLLESALARPQNLAAYADPDIASLAAAYAFGLARNHPFVDGNKRTSFVVTELFLDQNGYELMADNETCLPVWLELAGGALGEDALADWLRENIRPR